MTVLQMDLIWHSGVGTSLQAAQETMPAYFRVLSQWQMGEASGKAVVK